VYLSGDHNPQGVRSLLEILKDFSWDHIHVIAGIGVDKDADEMLGELAELKNAKLYLTVTPFKGRTLNQYPKSYLDLAVLKKENPIEILNDVAQSASGGDLIIVTGSLYLVGEVLKFVNL
jgi:dihydrofolate synthase/folylpolyglutamate synthase